jgi:hypothetical protein
MDIGPALLRRETRRSLVSSPSAAKTDAEPASCAVVLELSVLGTMFLDQRHDHGPAALVRGEDFGWHAIYATYRLLCYAMT